MSIADKYLSFSGRLRRRDWWLLSIAMIVVSLIIGQLAVYALVGPDYTMIGQASQVDKTTNTTALGIQIIMTLLFLWPSLALTAKRTHDRDQGATVNIVLSLISTGLSLVYSGMIMTGALNPAEPTPIMLLFGIGPLLIGLYLLIVLGFLDGTPDENRFGPSPKEDPIEPAA